MEALWAPWRMEFIKGKKPDTCVFCDAFRSGKAEKERLVLHVGPRGGVLMNRFPYGHGHLLIMPRRHTAELTELTREENAELMELLQVSTEVLREAMAPHGFNVGLNVGRAGGAGIEDHIHWHLLPRWLGDVNFITLVAELRTIPEHIAITYDRLRPLFAKRLGGPSE
jgi:ATP adenylyltransferase